MKKTIIAFFISIIPAWGFAWCDQYSDNSYCCDWDCNTFFCGDWDVGVEALIWEGCATDIDIAARLELNNNGTANLAHEGLCLDWKPGFRVWLGKENFLCGWDLYASYSYMRQSASREVLAGNNVLLTIPYLFNSALFDSVRGSYTSRYNEWEAVLGTTVNCSPCVTFTPYFGATGIVFTQTEAIGGFIGTENPALLAGFDWNRKYWGAGLRVGAYLEREIGRCFSLFGNGSASIVYGKVSGETNSTVSALPLLVREHEASCCAIVPGWHLQTGIQYNGDICCRVFHVRFGYEFVAWQGLPNPSISNPGILPAPREIGYASSSQIRNIGFHGIFLGLDVVF